MAHRSSALLLLLAASLTHGASNWTYCPEHEQCVHFPILHSNHKDVMSKRAVEVELANRTDIAYYAQLEIGTPAQPQYVQLDTGSFELWVNPTCTGLSLADATFCNSLGFYDTTQSSTVEVLDTTRTLAYGIGEANITYVKDTIALPGAATAMTDVQFGVATSSTDEFSGILGIGYGYGLTTTYPNFVDELAAQNQTAVKAFSVGLGSKAETEGAIVFGGVDTSKFAGTLASLPIVPAEDSPDGVPRYWLSMRNVSLMPPSGNAKVYSNTSMDVFLDTGATLTLLPAALADEIGADFGAYDGADASGYYSVDCALNDLDGSVDFAFDGVTVQVPYREFIRETTSGGVTSCVLGITASDTFTLLGDSFLRSAYAVFDLETDQIHMQQYQNCGSTPAAVTDVAQFVGLEGKCGGGSGTSSNGGTRTNVGTGTASTSSSSSSGAAETTTTTSDDGSDSSSSSSGSTIPAADGATVSSASRFLGNSSLALVVAAGVAVLASI